ncbi:hypothetical protein SAMN04488115_103211 [Bosea lathyri]|uniref:Membrane-anchored ribosome-binding protein, inhibits growth in stationary phase, ElaB/YqjD/DUF883 family n=1 Tax=Bosea lathyri TaxID=1036778 RepID=A0A1H5XEG0_9HYPH|nr:hypothetical protein SAMN04488115_103211 [Bosea lathyri]
MSPRNPAVASLKIEQRAQRKAARHQGSDAELQDALEATFPASDPVSAQAPVTAGRTESQPFIEIAEQASERVSKLQELLMNEVRARPLRALGWAAAAGIVLGFWAAR